MSDSASFESDHVPSLFRHIGRADFRTKPFVVLGQKSLSYGSLCDVIARTARLFQESGIGLGDRIVILSEHEIEVIVLYAAALRMGVTAALIDPQSSIDEARNLVRAAEPKALFVDRRFLDATSFEDDLLPGGRAFAVEAPESYEDGRFSTKAGGVGAKETSYPASLGSFAPLALPESIPAATSAFILFTSGTTSRPKGVEVTHHALTTHLESMHRQYGYDTDSRILNGLPLHHSDGINHGAVNVLAAGATLFRTGPFAVHRLPDILRRVKRDRITHMVTVPTVLALIMRLGDEFSDAFRTSAFKFVSSTAGPLDEGLWRKFEARFGTMIVNSYGLTETVCEGLYCGPTAATRRIGTVGKPIDVEARLLDDEGKELPQGETGEIVLRGTCLMKGYYNAPEETAAVLRDGWLYTGDLAVKDADGFYSIVGRKKDVIITGGVNVYPGDVSRVIARMPGIADTVTLGIADEIWGERVVACVVANPGAGVTADDVVAYCRTNLSREKVPSQVFVVEDLPRGPAGKVALPQVRKLVAELLKGTSDRAAPSPPSGRSDVAARVLELAARSFATPAAALSPDSEPETTAGWTSLAHVDFLVALEAEFGITISPTDMLSITSLADVIDLIVRVCSTPPPHSAQ